MVKSVSGHGLVCFGVYYGLFQSMKRPVSHDEEMLCKSRCCINSLLSMCYGCFVISRYFASTGRQPAPMRFFRTSDAKSLTIRAPFFVYLYIGILYTRVRAMWCSFPYSPRRHNAGRKFIVGTAVVSRFVHALSLCAVCGRCVSVCP